MTSITAGAAILPTTLGGVQAVIPLGLTSLLLVLMQDLVRPPVGYAWGTT